MPKTPEQKPTAAENEADAASEKDPRTGLVGGVLGALERGDLFGIERVVKEGKTTPEEMSSPEVRAAAEGALKHALLTGYSRGAEGLLAAMPDLKDALKGPEMRVLALKGGLDSLDQGSGELTRSMKLLGMTKADLADESLAKAYREGLGAAFSKIGDEQAFKEALQTIESMPLTPEAIEEIRPIAKEALKRAYKDAQHNADQERNEALDRGDDYDDQSMGLISKYEKIFGDSGLL